MDVLLKTTFFLIVLFSFLNFMLGLILFRSSGFKLYKYKSWFWFTLIINFFLQAMAQENSLQIITFFGFAFIPICILVQIAYTLVNEESPIKKLMVLPFIFYPISILFYFNKLPFSISALPLSIMVAIPQIMVAYKLLWTRRKTSTIFSKILGIIVALMVIHTFNFAFFRMVDGTQIWGWLIAYGFYQFIASLLPVISLDYLHKTESGRLEEIVSKRTIELQDANNSLLESLKTNELLFRVLIHDLATPLYVARASISRLDEVINSTNFDSDISKNLIYKIKHGTEQLENLITQVREFEKARNNNILIHKENLDINEMFYELNNMFIDIAEKKNLNIIFKTNYKNPLSIFADKNVFLHSIMANLIHNAIKFSHPNSTVTINALKSAKQCKIIVTDEGLGIPKKILDNIFNFNSKTHRRGTNNENGTGFGLPIVNEIVRLHNGSIHIESEVETIKQKGRTTVILELPMNANCDNSKDQVL